MKISFIATVFNEEESIEVFLDSLLAQTRMPDEVIIVDAGSNDGTLELIQKSESRIQGKIRNAEYRILMKKGNRSIGRNYAIKHASHEIIVASDAGCILDKNWVKKIIKPFEDKEVYVVAGYYLSSMDPDKGGISIFQKSLAAYTCVMPDKLNDDFLPSSRSIAFKKSAWKKVNGYPEELDTCEDLVFARKLKASRFTFYVSRNAIVYWPQKENLWEAFKQFFSYAKGDGQAHYFRSSTPFLFIRYLVGILLIISYFISRSLSIQYAVYSILIVYLLWSIYKNYRYVKHWKAYIYLPILQITSDIAVMTGMIVGFLR